MSKLLTFLGVAVLALALSACGSEGKPETLTVDELVARAYEAMTQTSFAADVPSEPPVPEKGQPPYSVKYGPTDLLLITGAGYEYSPYMFLVGTHEYSSITGKAWALGYGGDLAKYWLLWWDPRELLRIATTLHDEGTQELNGRVCRVVSAHPDIAKFAQLYVTGLELTLNVEIPSACPNCVPPCPECTLSPDLHRLESLGYRSPDGRGLDLFKDQDILIKVSPGAPQPGRVYITVRGVRELSSALREELRQVVEVYGGDPESLDTAEIRLDDEGERFLAQDAARWAETRVRFWIDPETLLVSQMEISQPGRRQESPLAFVNYGEVTLPEPEPAMPFEEIDVLFQEVGRRSAQLSEALEAYARSHDGLYPQSLAPDVLRETLEEEGLQWPENAFTGQPMKETAEQNPGDFHYEPLPDRRGYCAAAYDWYGRPMTVYPPGPLGPLGPLGWEEKCPQFGGSYP